MTLGSNDNLPSVPGGPTDAYDTNRFVVPGFFAFDPVPTAVPEPSTWAMMLLGFTGLGFAFRQSRRKVSFA